MLRVFCIKSLGGLYLEGLINGGAYFQNFMVFYLLPCFNLFILHPLITVLQGVANNIFRIIITSLYNNNELIT